MSHHYGKPLAVKMEGGVLTIEIGVHTLAHAVAFADWSNPFNHDKDENLRMFAISDPEAFAKDVIRAMLHEDELGASPLSGFLDRVTEAAVDDGAEGCEFDQQIKHGEFAACEKWAVAKDGR